MKGRRFVVSATFLGTAAFVLLPSCARSAPPPDARAPEPARSAGPAIAMASSSFVIESCPDAKKMDSRAAEAAMRKLIEPCSGRAIQPTNFLVTLVPGGRMEIASHGTDGGEGVVPVCVLTHQLTHSVALKQRCTFNIKLEPPAAVSPAPVSSAASSVR